MKRGFRFAVVAFSAALGQTAVAQVPPVDVQAFSDDPRWTVVVSPTETIYTHETPDYPIFNRLPAAREAKRGAATVYTTRFANGTVLELAIERAACKGAYETTKLRATLTVGGQTTNGCANEIGHFDLGNPLALADFDLDARFKSYGGPAGFSLDLNDGGQSRLRFDGRDYVLAQPAEVVMSGSGWPVIEKGAAIYRLMLEDEATETTATITAAPCSASGTSYPLTLTVAFSGRELRSCAAHAYPDALQPIEAPVVTPIK